MSCHQMSHLKILLAVEDNGLSLDLPVLDVHLVAGQHNGDVLANPALRIFRLETVLTHVQSVHWSLQDFLTQFCSDYFIDQLDFLPFYHT